MRDDINKNRHTKPLSFRGYAGMPADDSYSDELFGDIFTVVAGCVAFVVIAAWIGLWAINKPVHPFACDQHRSECAAASEPF